MPSPAAAAPPPPPFGHHWAFLTEAELDTALLTTFLDYKAAFNKTYASAEEEQTRLKNYLDLRLRLLSHADPNSKVAPNHLSDLNATELLSRLGHRPGPPVALSASDLADLFSTAGRRRTLQQAPVMVAAACPFPFSCYPAALDWTNVSIGGVPVVTPVKDQGGCGSCYAHAITAVVESNIAINFRTPAASLSRQAVVDCLNGQGSCFGCNGGLEYSGLAQAMSVMGGIALEAAYPYTSGYTGMAGTCQQNATAPAGARGRWASSTSPFLAGEDVLMAMLQTGPVAISLDAGNAPNFESYASGVYSVPCTLPTTPSNNDHAVTLVGYGVDATTGALFWKIKNSWGKWWGEAGYGRILRFAGYPASKAGLCGMALVPVQ